MSDEGSTPALVVDNSMALKWYLPEEFTDEALRAFYAGRDGRALLVAPTLIHAEFGNVLWRQYEDGKLSLEEINYYWTDFRGTPVYLFETEPLVSAALDIATECKCTVYDGLYVALAEAQRDDGQEGTVVLTADETLLRKLEGTPYEELGAHVRDVSDHLPVS